MSHNILHEYVHGSSISVCTKHLSILSLIAVAVYPTVKLVIHAITIYFSYVIFLRS